MDRSGRRPAHSTDTSNLADILERVLDKGVVIAGDIKVKLVDIELLTIQVRLLIASVDKAREMGMDFWLKNPDFVSRQLPPAPPQPAALEPYSDSAAELADLRRRIAELERAHSPA